ncbi:tetratricopeptide repeat-containing sensor histidine kinase [Tenacibaculum retecalamus]|uniref:tetratricopeptide repeat-containing sensor histidine kinase n=1 Tax=Tenacibaculum retecalamus TaxID=3018315 RepID=UPI0023D8FF1A|nr:tetratricopeptide repeat-containing sensor histidine kinase [Tenacibaculum retecalamus]WBX71698.1 histidine kinase [Tenacibaculum retecalamus]
MIKFIFKYLGLWLFLCSIVSNSQINKLRDNSIKSEKELIGEAFFLLNNNEPEKAYMMAKELKKSIKSRYALMNSNMILAYYFNRNTAIDSSIFYAKESLRLNTEGGDSLKAKRKSTIYNLLGKNYNIKGLNSESKKWYIKGIEEAQKYNEKYSYYANTHGLALTYYNDKDLKKALSTFKECLSYVEDKEITYGSYINIGMIYGELKQYNASNEFLKKAYDISLIENNAKAMAVILLNLADNAVEQKNTDKAKELYTETIAISNKEGFYQLKTEAKIGLGNIYVFLKSYENAGLTYSVALIDAIEYGLLGRQLKIYEKLKKLAIKRNNYKDAYYHNSNYFKIRDSINELQKVEKINELEVKYETIKKEKEIVLLKKDQDLQEFNLKKEKENKKLMLASFLILLVLVISVLVNYYLRLQAQSELNKKEKEINLQKVTTLYKEKELELIKANITGRDIERERIAQELHDSIGGNLAAIKLQLGSTKITNPAHLKKVSIQIDDTYTQVRNISHSLISDQKKGDDFCDAIEIYLNNIGDSSNIVTSFTVHPKKKINGLPQDIKAEVFKIIQELITNTLKHAKASFMELNVNLSDNKRLSIMFEDNGVGFNFYETPKGLGYVNIKNRLDKIDGTLMVDSKKGRGTIINIEIERI